MIQKVTLGIVLLILMVSLITLNRVFGLKALMQWELSNFEMIIKQRTKAFLDVFRKFKQHENDGH
ncbi:hypothetical protein DYU05_03995 [Mucilaginibacter terrenus]|uniref:Uncharacterized protein n=1 Tax=Mucilaginibacter terrenus TaxID=2482727 RepID=A0A3E2NUZ8_9SPHI|nr:hypothetical protein [Mucilaginibacter terrenus]RFZ84777.1 hypothetical protein DYU05_03995 [Mucilaginibacter terrenus]